MKNYEKDAQKRAKQFRSRENFSALEGIKRHDCSYLERHWVKSVEGHELMTSTGIPVIPT